MSSNNSTVPASSTAPASSSLAPISSSQLTSSIDSATSTPVDTSTPTSSQQTTAAPTTNDFTSTVIASSLPPTTVVQTHVVTNSGETPSTVVVTVTSSASRTTIPIAATSTDSSSSAASSTAPAAIPGQSGKDSNNGGLSAGGKTAIAVVIPVVVVALLVLGGIFLWRRRKQRKNAEEARRKEVEEYGFNPNNDPTLPAVAGMAEDSSGYRGWGNTTASARNPSTTLSGGHTQPSDTGSNPGGYNSPGSPTMATGSDGHSVDPLMGNRRETMDSETIGALGAAPAAGTNRSDIHRGPSNASSSYSAANHSDHSGDAPIPVNGPQDYYTENAYYQQGPYGAEPYGGQQQPIIRDVQARRNTRIENPSVFPQQGNSGISANF